MFSTLLQVMNKRNFYKEHNAENVGAIHPVGRIQTLCQFLSHA
jgi:hypothetical protein